MCVCAFVHWRAPANDLLCLCPSQVTIGKAAGGSSTNLVSPSTLVTGALTLQSSLAVSVVRSFLLASSLLSYKTLRWCRCKERRSWVEQ